MAEVVIEELRVAVRECGSLAEVGDVVGAEFEVGEVAEYFVQAAENCVFASEWVFAEEQFEDGGFVVPVGFPVGVGHR